MKRIKKSVGYAIEGLRHAFALEKNLRLFLPMYILVLILGGVIRLLMWEWLALVIAGLTFLAIELMNTALERLGDALDHVRKLQGQSGLHRGIKAAKDVGAASSLVALIALIATVLIVFWPYVALYFLS